MAKPWVLPASLKSARNLGGHLNSPWMAGASFRSALRRGSFARRTPSTRHEPRRRGTPRAAHRPSCVGGHAPLPQSRHHPRRPPDDPQSPHRRADFLVRLFAHPPTIPPRTADTLSASPPPQPPNRPTAQPRPPSAGRSSGSASVASPRRRAPATFPTSSPD